MVTKVYLLQDGKFVMTKYKTCDYTLVDGLIHNDLGICICCLSRVEVNHKYKEKHICCYITCLAMDENEIRPLTFCEVIEQKNYEELK